jgi:Flp pilus assembly protein TadD
MTPIHSTDSLRRHIESANRKHRQGRLAEAEADYRKALAMTPGHPEILRLLGLLKHQTGDTESSIELLTRSVEATPNNARALEALGCLLKEVGRDDEAIRYLKNAVAANPDQRSAFYNLGMILIEDTDSLDAAVEAFERAVALDGEDILARGALASGLLKQRKPQAALVHIESVLAGNAGDVAALAHKTAALSQLGRYADVDQLVDLDSMLRMERFQGGDGFETAADLNEMLVRHILNHPTLGEEKTTVEGMDTGEIMTSDEPGIVALRRLVTDTVINFCDSLPVGPEHPFAASRPDKWFLSGWGVRMWRGGFQVPHYHKDAWVSGVYYVQLPEPVKNSPTSQDGWIEFGRGPDDLYWDSTPRTRRIQPEEGLLIAFPSYAWHRTLPFDDPCERLCISFNIVPEQ